MKELVFQCMAFDQEFFTIGKNFWRPGKKNIYLPILMLIVQP
jgi:hypothetical protein